MARKSAIRAGLAKFALAITKQSVDYFENVYFDDDLKAIPPKIGKQINKVLLNEFSI